uniref:Rx N-terminal domain-containing protein n=1 Tax=Triticum urartu TaxID=4572 RepID=A0A8R7QSW4_TRIUA
MEMAIGTASWLVGKVLNKLSDDLVAAYVASSDLGINSEQIRYKLQYMQGLLHAAQEKDVSSNPGLQSLLEGLSKKADEAEDALDELHYFMIQDKLDDTNKAAAELGDSLRAHARHSRHAARRTIAGKRREWAAGPPNIWGHTVGVPANCGVIVACNERAFPVCRPCCDTNARKGTNDVPSEDNARG